MSTFGAAATVVRCPGIGRSSSLTASGAPATPAASAAAPAAAPCSATSRKAGSGTGWSSSRFGHDPAVYVHLGGQKTGRALVGLAAVALGGSRGRRELLVVLEISRRQCLHGESGGIPRRRIER